LSRRGEAASPLRLPRRLQAVRDAAGLPHLRHGPRHRLLPQGPRGGRVGAASGAQEVGAGRRGDRRRTGRPDPPGAGRVAVPRGGYPKVWARPRHRGVRTATEAADPGAPPPSPGGATTRTTQGARRRGRPEEIANAVPFFASDEASVVRGVELFVDGG
jgi:Enoyl-(Acyl carrier protein) reductase